MRACGYEGADPVVIEMPRDLPEAKGKRELAARVRRVDVLAQLRDAWLKDKTGRAGITDEHYRAGRRFQKDCERAELRARGSGYLAGGGGVYALPDGTMIAMERAGEAKGRLILAFGYLGEEALGFAVLVLLKRAAPSAAASLVGWNRHAGIAALRLVLSVLARVYIDNRGQDCS